jgi:uncharacterized protein YceK
MARALLATGALIVAIFLSGCGTFANLSIGARQGWKNAQIYGGVRRDVQSAEEFIAHSWTSGDNLDIPQDIGTVVGVGLVGIDVPLSAIADTLTLPLTIPAAIWGSNGNAITVSRKNAEPGSGASHGEPKTPPHETPTSNRSRSPSSSGRKAPDGSSPSS